jgi:RND superfamily putative drug exporter
VATWGRFVHRHRFSVLALSTVLLVLSVVLVIRGGELKNNNHFDFESGTGFGLMDNQLPKSSGLSFDLVMGSPTLTVASPEFNTAVQDAVRPLRSDHRVTAVAVPQLGAQAAGPAVSADRHYIVVKVSLADDFFTASQYYAQVRNEVRSAELVIHPAGDLALNGDFNRLSQEDLALADRIALPAALILLLLVFGSGPAALLCTAVGGFSVIGGLGAMYELSHHTDVSVYALNMVSLVGLGISIDYSLFIVNRFREELRRGASREDALAVAMARAGRAIIYSGLTVAVGLCALLFYHGTFLASLGMTGGMVVVIAVLYSITLLPALLAVLGDGVNLKVIRWLALRLLSRIAPARALGLRGTLRRRAEASGDRRLWHRLAMSVMRHPWRVLLPCLALLLLAGSPVAQMRLANANVTLLPPDADVRQGYDLLADHFGTAGQNDVDLVLDFGGASPFAPASVAAAETESARLHATAGVTEVRSYVDLPTPPPGGYAHLYAGGVQGLPAGLAKQVEPVVGPSITVLHAVIPYAVPSDDARAVVREIRSHDTLPGVTAYVTGDTPFDMDFVDFMVQHTPGAVGFVMLVTFAILLLLLRSIALPLKAVVMNLLSLSAAFGAMVFIFQQGHLSGVLNFTPASIDPTLPILLFCIVFGLSMDYEVFLLTRMQEAYRTHGDNRRAVADGLEASGRLVTGAAAIMIAVFAAFALASVVVVKSVGLGMAIAVFVDATIVRALVVPAIMRLLGTANWWAPRWMRARSELSSPAEAA